MSVSHKPELELHHALAAAKQQVGVGGLYYHYKHPDQLYQVVELAILEATDEVCVVYRADYGEELPFVRPLSSWLDEVEVEGVWVPRFAEAGHRKGV